MQKTIVLLGASNNTEGKLSQMSIDRLECAYDLYTSNRDVHFLCTGGFGEHFNVTEIPHAEYLKRWLCNKGVEADDISHCLEEQHFKCGKEVINGICKYSILEATECYNIS